MSFKHTVVSGAAALALMTASSYAALEIDGTGDYLLYPATYITADGTWSTDIKVVNTNTTHAVVSRVVIRRGDDSEEIFDFPIYLTPGDVWVGTLQAGVDNAGKLVVKTSDDSAMLWQGNSILHANKVDGGIEITTSRDVVASTSDAFVQKTYVEIFGLAAYDASLIDATWQTNTPLDKETFFEYVRGVNVGSVQTSSSYLQSLRGAYPVDVTNEMLMGKQTIFAQSDSEASRRAMSHNAVALGDMSLTARTTEVIGTDTTIALMTENAIRATAMMEDAFSKSMVYVMYEGDGENANPTRVHFTDPVKKYHDELSELDLYYFGSGDRLGHYYHYVEIGHDNEENVSACQDVTGYTEISNDVFVEENCEPEDVNYEVYTIDFSGQPSETEYFFPSGGFMTYTLESNTTYNPYPAVVPTTFTATNIGGMYLNNHLDNAYLEY